MEPTVTPSKTPWYKRTRLILFAAGLLTAIVLSILYHLLLGTLSSQVKLSCHRPTTQTSQAEYCVYFHRNPGLFSAPDSINVGTSSDRGTFYGVPYGQDDISVAWDGETDAASITMPGTKLIIQAGTYVDTR